MYYFSCSLLATSRHLKSMWLLLTVISNRLHPSSPSIPLAEQEHFPFVRKDSLTFIMLLCLFDTKLFKDALRPSSTQFIYLHPLKLLWLLM